MASQEQFRSWGRHASLERDLDPCRLVRIQEQAYLRFRPADVNDLKGLVRADVFRLYLWKLNPHEWSDGLAFCRAAVFLHNEMRRALIVSETDEGTGAGFRFFVPNSAHREPCGGVDQFTVAPLSIGGT